jgi:putative transposase
MKTRESRYPSDLSNKEWQLLEPFMPISSTQLHRPREHSWREILNAIFYINKAGCSWRMLPSDFPHWKTVYHYFRLWRKSGFLEQLNHTLREQTRVKASRAKQPSAAILDSQSVKTSEKGGSEAMTEARKSKVVEGI